MELIELIWDCYVRHTENRCESRVEAIFARLLNSVHSLCQQRIHIRNFLIELLQSITMSRQTNWLFSILLALSIASHVHPARREYIHFSRIISIATSKWCQWISEITCCLVMDVNVYCDSIAQRLVGHIEASEMSGNGIPLHDYQVELK